MRKILYACSKHHLHIPQVSFQLNRAANVVCLISQNERKGGQCAAYLNMCYHLKLGLLISNRLGMFDTVPQPVLFIHVNR